VRVALTYSKKCSSTVSAVPCYAQA
jgi:hypothetical protein